MSLPETTIALEILIARGTGFTALTCLLISQSITPLGPLLKRSPLGSRWQRRIRKYSGITAAILALIHGAFLFFTFLRQDLSVLAEEKWLHAGLAAALVFLVLLISSFKSVIRVLGMFWKPLHALSYSLWLLIPLHLWGAPYAPFWAAPLTFGVGAALLLSRIFIYYSSRSSSCTD